MVETRRNLANIDATAPPPGTTMPVVGVPMMMGTGSTFVQPTEAKILHQTESGNTVGVGLNPSSSLLQGTTLPSNAQIDSALINARTSLETMNPQLTEQGRRIAMNAEEVIDSAQRLLHNKNQDEKLQRLMREASLAGKEAAHTGTMVGQNIRGDSYQTTGLAKDTFSNAKDVSLFLLRDSQFRSFWLDLITLLRSVLQDINMRHGDILKQSVKQDSHQAVSTAASQVQQAVNQQQGLTNSSSEPLLPGLHEQMTHTSSTTGFTDSTMSGNWSTQQPVTTGATRQAVHDVAQDLRSGQLGDENLKQNIEMKFDQMLLTLAQHPQYNQAIQNIFMIFDAFRDRMDRIRADPNYTITNATHFQLMMTEAWSLLAEFCGAQTLQQFETVLWQIYSDLRNDTMAQQFFSNVKNYIQFSIQNPTQLTDEYRTQQGRMLLDEARGIFNMEKSMHRDNFNLLFNLATNILNSIKNDSDTRALTQSVGNLTKSMLFDQQGRPDFFVAQESMDQLKRMIVPLLQKQLERIPLPMIEGSTEKYDYRIENLVMNGRDIVPDFFDLKMVNNFSLGQRSGDKVYAKLKLKASNIRVMFPDMAYFYRRKKMPRLEDHGIADVGILGNGLSLNISWRLYAKENTPLQFELTRVKVFIDKLDINVKQSQHKLLNKIALKMFGGAIKRRVSAAINEKIRNVLTPWNSQLNEFFRREREGHNLRERANARLQDVYMQRQQGTGVGVTQKIKDTVSNVVGTGINLANTTKPPTTTESMLDTTGYQPLLNEGSFSSEQSIPLQTQPIADYGTMREKQGKWHSAWEYNPDLNSQEYSNTAPYTQPMSSQPVLGTQLDRDLSSDDSEWRDSAKDLV
jgi:ElaB/YqjD/DUF883 family membrane-anchored ribosome-binding protein